MEPQSYQPPEPMHAPHHYQEPPVETPMPSPPQPELHATSMPGSKLNGRSAEYAMQTISLWVLAGSLSWILIDLVNGINGFNDLVGAVSALITSLPLFGFFFLRLKRAEAAKPEMRNDISRKRWAHFTQIIAFLICLINVVTFIYIVLSHIGGSSSESIFKAFLDLVIVLVIGGGVLVYYWMDTRSTKPLL